MIVYRYELKVCQSMFTNSQIKQNTILAGIFLYSSMVKCISNTDRNILQKKHNILHPSCCKIECPSEIQSYVMLYVHTCALSFASFYL